LLASDIDDASERLRRAALESKDEPLYVLIWGSMTNLNKAFQKYPEIADKVRLITIGTGLRYNPKGDPATNDCKTPNWNGPGRSAVFNDNRFNNMWWLEINWGYEGMFTGKEPKEMFEKLARFGEMGQHMKVATKNQAWAQYFRVGDTPSVLYLIDQQHNPDDPTESSWAGKYKKPFPETRPHYYTDDNGAVNWDYADPCKTWINVNEVLNYSKATLEKERPEMYRALLHKLSKLYRNQK
jgi:hypothetical protein